MRLGQKAKLLFSTLAGHKKQPKQALNLQDVTTHRPPINLEPLQILPESPAWMANSERLLIYTLVFTLMPERYLEIGTFQGGSALIVDAAMKASNNSGRMVCVDPMPKIAPEHWAILDPRTTLLEGTSPEILPQAKEAAGGLFDFVLIDGGHDYQEALDDAEGVLPFVTDSAYLLFHDSLFNEVETAIDDFIKLHPGELVDFGTLTREITYVNKDDGTPVRWGGIRVVQVRRGVQAI